MWTAGFILASVDLWRVLRLEDHTTRVVVIGTAILGAAAGVIGTFTYLRGRAMLGDALSHATLPGIAAAFLLFQQKLGVALLIGAAVTGSLGVLAVMGLRKLPRIKEDAAIGIVLSVFFGMGMVLLSFVQQMGTGEEAGLAYFIYGKAAAMSARDAEFIAWAAVVVMVGAVLLHKEFRILCFDKTYAASLGWPVGVLDLLMMGLVVMITVVGLQAVGLIMVVSLLIIPAATARLWTDQFSGMIVLAGFLGALSGYVGSNISALAPRLPTGAIIVLSAGGFFLVSMLASPHRGIVAGVVRRVLSGGRVRRQHLLRALAEHEEQVGEGSAAPFDGILRQRSWTYAQLRRLGFRMARAGLIERTKLPALALTKTGRADARRVLRNHRLWELYLIRYADIAPSHVDRDADMVEHVLTEPVIKELEAALAATEPIPASPHPLEIVR